MKYTLQEFLKEYPNDAACLDRVFKLRFGDMQRVCPCCGKETTFRRVVTRRSYQCRLCYHQLYPTANTPFNKTRTPLNYWFYVMYLMTTTRNGVASTEVQRALGVTYKTAHKMTTQIRKLMQEDHKIKLRGYVEIDETYVSTGKSKKGDTGRGTESKKPVFAVVERLGEVRATVMPEITIKHTDKYLQKHVSKDAHISTDEFPLYNGLKKRGFINHGVIKHAMEEYRKGETSTNTIEGFFSQLKRMIFGTHIHVSEQHLQKYVDEAVFRYNHRFKDVDMFGCLVLRLIDYQEKPSL
jgi:transposase-like protein